MAAKQAEAVPDRIPYKRANVPKRELGVVNFPTVVEFCEFLETNLFPSNNLRHLILCLILSVASQAVHTDYLKVMVLFCDSLALTHFICHTGNT